MKFVFQNFVLLLSILVHFTVNAQFSDFFSDGNINENPIWQGSTDDFSVNDELQLQLNAAEAGNSKLYTNYKSEKEQEWQFYFNMDFDPSNTNRIEIFLEIDNSDISVANGYSIKIGENGANDALVINKYLNGQRSEIARGADGNFANDPSTAQLKILRDIDGFWQVFVDINNTGRFESSLEFFDDSFEITDAHFLIACNYTSSRKDKFTFDNIYVGPKIVDTIPPTIISVDLLSKNSIQLNFSEILDETTALDLQNYTLTPNNTELISANFIEGSLSEILLVFQQDFLSGTDYEIAANGISDLSNNVALTKTNFLVLDKAFRGDILINEILFNPYSGGKDFVEIINVSDKLIDLSGINIANRINGQDDLITSVKSIAPGEILAFSEDVDFLNENYDVNHPENLRTNNLPAFNNDDGNVSLINALGDTIDSFDYTEDFHFALLDDPDGVSLERVSLQSATNKGTNWTSAASAIGFATPGYENSASFAPNSNLMGQFELNRRVFSPNNDSIDDKLVVEYKLDENSYVINANIYDDQGRIVKKLLRNEQLATSGFFVWDGTNDDLEVSKIGIYIIWIQIFSPDGKVSENKISFTLADKLN